MAICVTCTVLFFIYLILQVHFLTCESIGVLPPGAPALFLTNLSWQGLDRCAMPGYNNMWKEYLSFLDFNLTFMLYVVMTIFPGQWTFLDGLTEIWPMSLPGEIEWKLDVHRPLLLPLVVIFWGFLLRILVKCNLFKDYEEVKSVYFWEKLTSETIRVLFSIGPESDHWEYLSLTDWLTNWLTDWLTPV